MIVDEHQLDIFRAEELTPSKIITDVEKQVQVLYRVGVGVGKSLAVDRLLTYPDTFGHFDLVVYAAPARNILNERRIVAGRDKSPVPWLLLQPRPFEECGPYAVEWEKIEKAACTAYGKGTLCRECQEVKGQCFWPDQFTDLEGLQLIFTTEQQIVLNRSLVWMLKSRAKAKRVLVILDEARLLDSNFEILINPIDLDHFKKTILVLRRPKGIPFHLVDRWCQGIEFLQESSSRELTGTHIEFPPGLNRHAYHIQAEGIRTYGQSFQYSGYDLMLFQWSGRGERWKDSQGTIHFTARPYLNCHLLILSAHLTSPYTSHRLGSTSIISPFENTRFCHTGSRIYNLRNRIGADAYFKRNHKQILDLFSVLILRNMIENRSTILISRKKSKQFCAEYLQNRLRGWGLDLKFITEGYDQLPNPPAPDIIPIIHYGILGVNDFTEYESAYCLNSYYVSTHELNRQVQEAEPDEFRVRLKIVSGSDMMRRVEIEDRGTPDLDRTALGNIYLRKLEVDPVIQAAGRVRFLTHPREVIFFQMFDFVGEVGECIDTRSLAELMKVLRIPRAAEIDREMESAQAHELITRGFTVTEAAASMGISKRTFFRRDWHGGCAKNPNNIYIRLFGTPPPGSSTEEACHA